MASKILVIEDDRARRNAVVSALQSGGYEVEFAADGSAGVQALSAKTFDVVLLDIGLPFVDGWHVLSTLEGRWVPPEDPKREAPAEPRSRREGLPTTTVASRRSCNHGIPAAVNSP